MAHPDNCHGWLTIHGLTLALALHLCALLCLWYVDCLDSLWHYHNHLSSTIGCLLYCHLHLEWCIRSIVRRSIASPSLSLCLYTTSSQYLSLCQCCSLSLFRVISRSLSLSLCLTLPVNSRKFSVYIFTTPFLSL